MSLNGDIRTNSGKKMISLEDLDHAHRPSQLQLESNGAGDKREKEKQRKEIDQSQVILLDDDDDDDEIEKEKEKEREKEKEKDREKEKEKEREREREREKEKGDVGVPLSMAISSTMSQTKISKCSVCDIGFGTLSQSEREVHINECLDRQKEEEEGDDAEKMERTMCQYCGRDLAKLTKTKREEHIGRCSQTPTAENSVCPVCKKSLVKTLPENRHKHIKACAKKNNISHKDLSAMGSALDSSVTTGVHHEKKRTKSTLTVDEENGDLKSNFFSSTSKPQSNDDTAGDDDSWTFKKGGLGAKVLSSTTTAQSTTTTTSTATTARTTKAGVASKKKNSSSKKTTQNVDDSFEEDIKMAMALSESEVRHKEGQKQLSLEESVISSTPVDLAGFKFPKPPSTSTAKQNESMKTKVSEILFPVVSKPNGPVDRGEEKTSDSDDFIQPTPKFTVSNLANKYPSSKLWEISKYRDENQKDLTYCGSQQVPQQITTTTTAITVNVQSNTNTTILDEKENLSSSQPSSQLQISTLSNDTIPTYQQPVYNHPSQGSTTAANNQTKTSITDHQSNVSDVVAMIVDPSPAPKVQQTNNNVNSNTNFVMSDHSNDSKLKVFFEKITSISREYNNQMVEEKERAATAIKNIEKEFYSNIGKLVVQREIELEKVKQNLNQFNSGGFIIFNPNMSDTSLPTNIMTLGSVEINFPISYQPSPFSAETNSKLKKKRIRESNHSDHDLTNSDSEESDIDSSNHKDHQKKKNNKRNKSEIGNVNKNRPENNVNRVQTQKRDSVLPPQSIQQQPDKHLVEDPYQPFVYNDHFDDHDRSFDIPPSQQPYTTSKSSFDPIETSTSNIENRNTSTPTNNNDGRFSDSDIFSQSPSSSPKQPSNEILFTLRDRQPSGDNYQGKTNSTSDSSITKSKSALSPSSKSKTENGDPEPYVKPLKLPQIVTFEEYYIIKGKPAAAAATTTSSSSTSSSSYTYPTKRPDYENMTLAELKYHASNIGVKTTGKDINRTFLVTKLSDVWDYTQKKKK